MIAQETLSKSPNSTCPNTWDEAVFNNWDLPTASNFTIPVSTAPEVDTTAYQAAIMAAYPGGSSACEAEITSTDSLEEILREAQMKTTCTNTQQIGTLVSLV